MPHVERKIEIKAPRENIFKILDDTISSPTWNLAVKGVNKIEEDKFDALDKLKYIRPAEVEEKKEPTPQEKLERHNIWLQNIYKSFDEYVSTDNYDYFDFNKLVTE